MAGKIIPIAMPKWGMEMIEGQITKWNKDEGEAVSPGEELIDIETDKMTNVYEAEFSGVLRRRIGMEGETYPVGQLIGVVADESVPDAEIEDFVRQYVGGSAANSQAAPTSSAAGEPAGYARAPNPEIVLQTSAAPARLGAAEVEAQIVKLGMEISPIAARVAMDEGVDLTGVGATGRLGRISLEDVAHRAGRPVGARKDRKLISPRARKFAREKGIDPATLQGSGAEGRVLAADIASLGSSGVAGAFEIVRMSPMRKAIARQLSLSKSTIPHFYLRAQVCVDALLALREQTRRLEGQAFSVNDYLIRACALALRQVPDVNIQVHGDEIRRFAHADIAVAVATEKGLLTPIIRAAETKSVAAISREMRSLAESARAGSLKSEDYQGGSFSLSNLGMFGIDQFDAIVNPPQGAILAVGAARRKPVEANFALSFATVVELSLSCDHRAIDGAVGARFMAALRTLIEDPETLTRAA